MCTFLVYFDPDARQRFTMASTRDEALDRVTLLPSESCWDKPEDFGHFVGKHGGRLHLNYLEAPAIDTAALPKNVADHALRSDKERYRRYINAGIQGPKDPETGGLFAGMNRHGVIVGVNNIELVTNHRNKLARGGLALDALTFSSARGAATSLYEKVRDIQAHGLRRGDDSHGDYYHYPSFNLIIADQHGAYVLQSAPIGILPEGKEVKIRGGEVKTMDTETGGRMTVIGDISGNHTVVSLEPIRAREPTIICGWSQNDPRSMRSEHFLPEFQSLIKEHPLPDGRNLASWQHWLAFMQERTKGQGGAYSNSIAQPPFIMSSERDMNSTPVTWGTISTSLFAINADQHHDFISRMYFSPSMPTIDQPMEFQRTKASSMQHHTFSDFSLRQFNDGYEPRNEIFVPSHDGHRALWCESVAPPKKNSGLSWATLAQKVKKHDPNDTGHGGNKTSGWDIGTH